MCISFIYDETLRTSLEKTRVNLNSINIEMLTELVQVKLCNPDQKVTHRPKDGIVQFFLPVSHESEIS